MKAGKTLVYLFLVIRISFVARPVAAELKLHIGPAELLYSSAQLKSIPSVNPAGFILDASFATLQINDSLLTMFLSSYNGIDKYVGTLAAPLDSVAWSRNERRLWSNAFHGSRAHAWIPNMHKRANGDLLGFVHVERSTISGAEFYRDATYSIGLAYSTDGGEQWIYCGDIIRPHAAGGGGITNNIGGIPFLEAGGYLHVYFNEWTNKREKRLCVARAKMSDVFRAAKRGTVTAWNKYSNGSWSARGLQDAGSNIVPHSASCPECFDLHSDAAFCPPLGKYLILVPSHDPGSAGRDAGELLLFSSIDAINWQDPIVIDRAAGARHFFATFASVSPDASDDCSTVGELFYILYPRRSTADTRIADLYRRKVTVSEVR